MTLSRWALLWTHNNELYGDRSSSPRLFQSRDDARAYRHGVSPWNRKELKVKRVFVDITEYEA